MSRSWPSVVTVRVCGDHLVTIPGPWDRVAGGWAQPTRSGDGPRKPPSPTAALGARARSADGRNRLGTPTPVYRACLTVHLPDALRRESGGRQPSALHGLGRSVRPYERPSPGSPKRSARRRSSPGPDRSRFGAARPWWIRAVCAAIGAPLRAGTNRRRLVRPGWPVLSPEPCPVLADVDRSPDLRSARRRRALLMRGTVRSA